MREKNMRSDLAKTCLRKSEAGMTLIELVIVLVILGLLTATLGTKVVGQMSKSKVKVAVIAIGEIEGGLQLYSFDVGHFPTTGEGLQALVQNTGSDQWDGPYLKKGLSMDPWGKPYIYKSPGDHGDYDLSSAGPDGEEGTEDDVCSWK